MENKEFKPTCYKCKATEGELAVFKSPKRHMAICVDCLMSLIEFVVDEQNAIITVEVE